MFSPYSGLCDASVNLCQKVSARKFTPEKVCRETVLWRNIRKSVRNVIGIVVLRKSIRQKMAGNSGNDSNLLIVFYVQIMPDDFVMQLHR
ncbi:hypothetical protein POX66_24215, partial [Escherichia coli]